MENNETKIEEKKATPTNEISSIASSKGFKWAILAVAEIILLAIVFSAGVKVGVRKASFSYAFGANYERNFAGPAHGPMGRPGMMGFFNDQTRDMRNAHGLAGTIISVTDNSIVVKDPSGNESTVAVNSQTLIKSRGADIKISDVQTGQKIVVIGKPDTNGVINAELIRIFDGNNQGSTSETAPLQSPIK